METLIQVRGKLSSGVPFDLRASNVLVDLEVNDKNEIVRVVELTSGAAGWPPDGAYKLQFDFNGSHERDVTFSGKKPIVGFPR